MLYIVHFILKCFINLSIHIRIKKYNNRLGIQTSKLRSGWLLQKKRKTFWHGMNWKNKLNCILPKTVKHPANLFISSNPVSITSLFTRTTAIKMRKTGRSNISQTYFLLFRFSMVPVQNKTSPEAAREVSQYSDYPWFSCKISDARFGNCVHCTALCLKHLERGSA